jgi:hypothetical protein
VHSRLTDTCRVFRRSEKEKHVSGSTKSNGAVASQRPNSPTLSESSNKTDGLPRKRLTKIEVWALGDTSYRIPLSFSQQDLEDNVRTQKPTELSAKYAALPQVYRSWLDTVIISKEQSETGQWLLVCLNVYKDKKRMSRSGPQIGWTEVHAVIGFETETMPESSSNGAYEHSPRPRAQSTPWAGRNPYLDVTRSDPNRRIHYVPQPEGTAIDIVQVDPDDSTSQHHSASDDDTMSLHIKHRPTKPPGDDSGEADVPSGMSDSRSVRSGANNHSDNESNGSSYSSSTGKSTPWRKDRSIVESDAAHGNIIQSPEKYGA